MTHYRTYFDRTEWRNMDARALVDAARDSGHELAIALGERLEELADADDELHDARTELRELDRRCDTWQREANELRSALEGNG